MVSKRLGDYIHTKGISYYAFENEIGASRGSISKAVKDNKNIGSNVLENILTHFTDLNADWLLKGEGEMLLNDAIQDLPKEELEKTALLRAKKMSDFNKDNSAFKKYKNGLPLIPTEAFAGFGGGVISIAERDIKDRYVVPEFIDADFMIRIKGSSMYPKYNSGDVVACKMITNSKFIQWNKVHVISTRDQGVLIKRLRKGEHKNSLLAVSDNTSYDSFEIPKDEIINIAIVTGVIRLE
jgi:phage repressor protein C with HTH and peptisase S24 domain